MLESKFIEGTNKQYSIRNDGVVISHYLSTRSGKVYKEKELSVDINKSVMIYIDKIKRTRSISFLLFDYFGFRLCNTCNRPFFIKENKVCNSCQRIAQNSLVKQKYKKNPEYFKVKNNRAFLIRKEKITKSYVASCLRVPVEGITEEIYKAYKTKLTILRKLKQIQNG